MIDLCVVNFNTASKLDRLCKHLYDSLPPKNRSWRLFVADNGSDDDSLHIAMKWEEVGLIDYIAANDNIGYSAACNQLASVGTRDVIGLLNADIWFTHDDTLKIQEIFDSDPTIGVFGPKQRSENHMIRHGGIVGTNTAPKHRGWNEYDPNDFLYTDQIDCVTVSGSAYFVRRTVWNELWHCEIYRTMHPNATGAFLPTPHYYEETWCSYHCNAHDYRVVYDGSVSIGHSWHASSEIGGHADQQFPVSQKIFREMCDYHGILHD